jgi:hypothetical protein
LRAREESKAKFGSFALQIPDFVFAEALIIFLSNDSLVIDFELQHVVHDLRNPSLRSGQVLVGS